MLSLPRRSARSQYSAHLRNLVLRHAAQPTDTRATTDARATVSLLQLDF